MCDKNLMLVKTIKKYPCIYNQNLTEYTRKDVTDAAWNEVANETNQTVSECKEKWKNLRYGFVRSLKPDFDGSLKKKYYLHNEMEFILPHIRLVSSKPKESPALEYEFYEENTDSNQDMLSSVREPHYVEYIEPPPGSEPPKRKIKSSHTITTNNPLQTKLQTSYIPRRQEEDLRRMFLLSLLPEVAELTEPQMCSFRREVLKLLDYITRRGNESTVPIWESNTVHHYDLMKSEPL